MKRRKNSRYITTVSNTPEGLKSLSDLKIRFRKLNKYIRARGRMKHRRTIFEMHKLHYDTIHSANNDIGLRSPVAYKCHAWALYAYPIVSKKK